ncbi:MAG: hypothetical protein JWO10_460 [Microbacteriaceae bacterium]|nr:hypothetical protein [Microbacteriaceae bacterium]
MIKFWKRFNTRERIATVFYALAIVAVVLQIILLNTGTLKNAFPTMLIVPVLLIVAAAFNLWGNNPRPASAQENDPNRR